MNIFVVIVCYFDKTKNPKKLIRQRTWGFYPDFETAKKCVEENWTDLYEMGYYNYALINEMPTGVCVHPKNHWWFEVNYPQGRDGSAKVKLIDYDPLNEGVKGSGRSFIGW